MPISEDISVGETVTFDKTSICRSCGEKLDSATSATGDHAPSPGDITICLYCGHLMAFADDKGNLRDLNDEEMLEVAGHPTILKIQEARALATNSLNRSHDANGSRGTDEERLEDGQLDGAPRVRQSRNAP